MFLIKNAGFLLLTLLFFSCNKKDRQLQQILALQQMNDLATVEYVITKIIRANDNKTWYKFGDRKILMSCKATLIAGIDLVSITREQVMIEKRNIQLSLPHAKLISISIKPEDIAVEYQELDMLRQPFSAEERNELAILAENQLKTSIAELGILQTAETNATLFVSNFLTRLGYKKININFDQSKSLKD
ncbi:MAG: DUF4230 domain-containing protein [Ferruginibacter sp.]|nr:DUF4230 domain-containing protein [Ferruginibacter sp.]